MGHLMSTVVLGKLFLSHGLAITIVTVDPPYNTGTTATFIARSFAALSTISFHWLPRSPSATTPLPHKAHSFDLLRLFDPTLLSFLQTLSRSSHIRAMVLDFFCIEALDIAAAVTIPAFFFFSPTPHLRGNPRPPSSNLPLLLLPLS